MKILTSLLILLLSNMSSAKECQENRGALDVGSGTTKALVVTVDTCKKKILNVVFEDRLPLSFNEALEKNGGKEIPKQAIDSAGPQIKGLIQKMQEYKTVKIQAVATSVFRVARNGREAAQAIAKEIGTPLTVISQEEEAELGYYSAVAKKNINSKDRVIVWDIGGGSMQMYAKEKSKAEIYKGNLASVTFKNKVLEILQFKSLKESPNPLGQNREAAIQIAKNHAYTNVPKYFKDNATKAKWIGVGGVLSASVQNQVNKEQDSFTEKELETAFQERSKLKDDQITGDYKTTDVTNLALVLGYMKALNIEKVETAKAALGEGLIYRDLAK